jgi:hypothetical protein
MTMVPQWQVRLRHSARRGAIRAYLAARALGAASARPYLIALRGLRRRQLRNWANARAPVVLFLAPEAGLKPFFASHAILARTLREHGQAAIVLSCRGLLSACTYKFAHGIKPGESDREAAACRTCRATALGAGVRYGLVDESVESLVDMAERATIDAIIERHRDSLSDLVHDGIAFGAVSIGDALRISRHTDVAEFGASEHQLARALVKAGLLVYFALRKLEARYRVTRIVFFGDYAFWIAAQAYAERHGIAVTHVDHGYNMDVDRRLIDLRPGSINAHTLEQVTQWPRHRALPISPRMAEAIGESSLFRLRGHGGASTYSPNWVRRETALQEELGLSSGKKTLVAYSSSLDEYVAVDRIMRALGKPYGQAPRPFADQHGWLRALIDWAARRDDLQLIVRLHPRLAAGRRHDAPASEYHLFRKEFTHSPANVVIVWPEDRVSSYNLAEIADASTVAWSTIGLEVARFGVPTVAAFSDLGPFPVGSFISFAPDPAGYFSAIERALSLPASLERITEAFRWTHYVHRSATIDVSDVIPARDYADLPPWRLPENHARIHGALALDEDVSTRTMAGLRVEPENFSLEQNAMRHILEGFAAFFIAGDERLARDGKLRLLQGRCAELDNGGTSYRQYSPLAHRLLAMLSAVPAPAATVPLS